MKIGQRNMIYSIVFIMGILLCYNIYLHINTVDLCSERNTTENCLTSDAQTAEDEQIIQLPEILYDFGVKIQFSSFTSSAFLINLPLPFGNRQEFVDNTNFLF
ncbi:MAG: hypothetical protein IPO21_08140 [Bacteroidales bacterium]|nr:hypothetical protein [Bacteroidales bacterium]